MNGFLKSTTLLLATLATPLASNGQAGDDHHDAKRVRKGVAGAPQNGPLGQGPQLQVGAGAPPQARGMKNKAPGQNSQQAGPPRSTFTAKVPSLPTNPAGGKPNARSEHGKKFQLGHGSGNRGGAVVPLDPGTIVKNPTIQLPVQNPKTTDNPPRIERMPGVVAKKPIGPSKKPINLSSKPIDLSPKTGKMIDPGFNAKRLPKLERHDTNKAAKPPIVLQEPNGSSRGPLHQPKLAEGHKLHIAQSGLALAERLKKGDLHGLVDAKLAKQVDLKKQFELHQQGDLSRRLNLGQQLAQHGGWQKRLCGPIDPQYSRHCFSSWYCGPSFFPGFCWFPQWSPWVNWCWNYNCVPVCDPRPIFCRPIYCDPCPTWVGWSYPVWASMPVVTCGTWVDVPTVAVNAGYDVQLLAVRFVDPGHPEQQLGPRYRVWLRNNSSVSIQQPFNVLVYASNDREPAMGLPEAGLRIQGMDAGQIQSVDLRLPFEANAFARDAEGRRVPFAFLHVIADSHREVLEAFEENNGAVLARGDILPVDPAIFAADSEAFVSGSVIHVAGEGFGPEPGQVLVNVGGLERQAEIIGWYDLGVQVRLPGLALASDASADLIVVRGDRAASSPLAIHLSAGGNVSQTTALQSP